MKKLPTPFRLGKMPPRVDSRTLRLANYLRLPPVASVVRSADANQQGTSLARETGSLRALAPAPPSIDWTVKISSWPMMANDIIGDCTCAAAGHMIECWTGNLGNAFTPTNTQIIAAYSAVSGYVASNPASDNGAAELDVLNYWRQQGIAGHKIDAYAALDVSNGVKEGSRHPECVKQAISVFGGAYIGLALPLSAQQQTVWDVPSLWSHMRHQDAPGSWGGHAVPVLAYDPDGLTCITWGAKKRMTWEFFARYCDEAYAPLSHDWFNAHGFDPCGLNLAQLTSDLSAITS